MAEHTHHTEDSQHQSVCDREPQIEDFRSLLVSFLWSPSSRKRGWEGDKTFFLLCQSLNYLLVAKSTKFTPTPPWMPKAPSVLYLPKPTTCYKSNSALHHSGRGWGVGKGIWLPPFPHPSLPACPPSVVTCGHCRAVCAMLWTNVWDSSQNVIPQYQDFISLGCLF